jgi:hypothetical protein
MVGIRSMHHIFLPYQTIELSLLHQSSQAGTGSFQPLRGQIAGDSSGRRTGLPYRSLLAAYDAFICSKIVSFSLAPMLGRYSSQL